MADKKVLQGRVSSTDLLLHLQTPNDAQINDNGEIPLVFMNDGAEDQEENDNTEVTRERRRSRIMSGVSMHSSTNEDVQEYDTVSAILMSHAVKLCELPNAANCVCPFTIQLFYFTLSLSSEK